MSKKLLNLMLCGILLFSMTACDNTEELKNNNSQNENQNNANSSEESNIKIVSGTGKNIGDEICIANECFYIINVGSNDIQMIAKYNLYVGETHTSYSNSSQISSSDAGYGLQSENAIGYIGFSNNNNSEYPIVAVDKFSDTQYWDSENDSSSDIFNNKSTIYNYIKNYENYLKEETSSTIKASLLTYNQAIDLGCNSNSCINAPSWLSNTTFWLGSYDTSHEDVIWVITAFGRLDNNTLYTNEYYAGVRPVVTINKSLLK